MVTKENTISAIARKLREYNAYLEQFSPKVNLPQKRFLPKLGLALEIVFVVALLYWSTPIVQNFAPDSPIIGNELSYLINGAIISRDIYHETGSLPLWNPFMARGEPMFESPHSFMMNPLMSVPILVLGPVLGVKIAVLIHLALAAAGGWTLAYILKLNTPGRLLLAVLIAASGGAPSSLNRGFYQIALSQAYLPWVYAGLIGTLYTRQRWPIGIFVVGTMLMIYAGSFWYVLPAAITCLMLVVFALYRHNPDTGKMMPDRAAISRVVLAGALIVGLGAARLIPQAAYSRYVYHPNETFGEGIYDFVTVVQTYFTPQPFNDIERGLHYISQPAFALFLFVVCILLPVAKPPERRRWRIIIPALIAISIFTIWAQGKTPIIFWLYQTFPILGEWRFLRRMLAAGTPLIAMLLAIGLEDLVHGILDENRIPPLIRWGAVLLVMVLAVATALDVLQNWKRVTGLRDHFSPNREGVEYIRSLHPNEFISIETREFWDYYGFFENRVRGAFGNPDYRALGLEPTIATPSMINFDPAYGLAVGDQRRRYFIDNGFTRIESPEVTAVEMYHKTDSISHVFLADYDYLQRHDPLVPLKRHETIPVEMFVHNMDSIEITVPGDYAPNSVLVTTDTAYPGWQVEINGERATLESVGGLLGVRLPINFSPDTPVKVVFFYQPTLFYVGSIITVITMIITCGYLLRGDRFFVRRKVEVIEMPQPVTVTA